jgi:hypothetical protein
MQGSVLGYENKFYLNKSKVEWVLQCILWVFGCNNLANKSTNLKETKNSFHKEAKYYRKATSLTYMNTYSMGQSPS